MRKLLALAFFLALAVPAAAQNNTCANRSPNDGSNACANTRYVDASATAIYNSFSGAFTCTTAGVCTLNSGVVSNSMLAPMPANTVKGNATGASATPTDLTASQQAGILGGLVFPGASPTQTTCWVDGKQFSTISAALAVCGSNAKINVTVNQSMTAETSVNGDNVKISCLNGATITHATKTRWLIYGKYFSIDGCSFVGPGKGTFNNDQLMVVLNDYFNFHDNRVTAFGATGPTNSSQGLIVWGQGNHGLAYNNYFSGNGDMSMSVQPFPGNNLSDFLFYSNTFEDLLVFPGTTNPATEVRVIGNQLLAGSWTGQQGICLFVANVYDSVVSGNTCKVVGNIATGTGGIYSFANNKQIMISDNSIVKTGSFDFADYSFEFNGCLNCTITGNYGETTTGIGMICEVCNAVTFTGNVQNGFKAGSSGFDFYDNQLPFTVQGNLNVGRNTAIFSPGVTSGTGILFTSANAGRTTNNILESGNVVVGPTSPGTTVGIGVAGTTGAQVNGVGMGPDSIRGTSIGHQASGPMTNLCRLPGAVFATTAFNNITTGPVANTCN